MCVWVWTWKSDIWTCFPRLQRWLPLELTGKKPNMLLPQETSNWQWGVFKAEKKSQIAGPIWISGVWYRGMQSSRPGGIFMWKTEIAMGKVLTQLIANYDPQESVDSASWIRIMCAKPRYFGGTHYFPQVNYISFRSKNLEVHSAKFVDA